MGRYVDAEAWMATVSGYGRRTYRAFVPHFLATWDPVLGASDLTAMTAADRALAEVASQPRAGLSGAVADWIMARDESIHSSVIEGVDATEPGLAWARYLDFVGRPVTDDNDALTLGAAKQTTAAVDLGTKMCNGAICSTQDILNLHNQLFERTQDKAIAGVLRDSPVWIGLPRCSVDEASFVPPPADYVASLLEDLVEYMNVNDHPPVLRAAVVHSQFETIHPFADGNGRTGRALIHTVLTAAGVTQGALPISTALSNDRRSYYDALNSIRVVCDDNDMARSTALSSWLNCFAQACTEAQYQAVLTTYRAEKMTARWLQAGRFRSGSAAAALVEALPSMPVLDADMVSKKLGITTRAARDALNSLEAAGIVTRTGASRNRRFTVPELVESLRHIAPDNGLPARPSGQAVPMSKNASRLTLSIPSVCDFVGTRSDKQCRLPKGHAGQHRYTTR